MSQRQVPTLAGVVQSDTASKANTLVERDPSSDIYGNSLRGDGPAFISAAIYGDPSSSQTISFAIDDTKDLWLVDATAGAVTVTLPVAATCAGLTLTIKRTSASNSVIIDGNGAETIDGAATKTITTQWGFITIQCNGTAWFIKASGGTIT